jgi:hypothetical protein
MESFVNLYLLQLMIYVFCLVFYLLPFCQQIVGLFFPYLPTLFGVDFNFFSISSVMLYLILLFKNICFNLLYAQII